MDKKILAKIFDAATSPCKDLSIVSYGVSLILKEGSGDYISKLGGLYDRNKESWLPEMLALFMGRGSLSTQEKRILLSRVFGGDIAHTDDACAESLADCCARIGRIGLSFPQWRFVSQGFNDASLLERFGYERLERTTDVRSPDVPKSNPARDEYGIGFVRHCGEWTVEYRRAYILCARQSDANPLTLVIRNSSHFFGRDRLPQPAFLCEDPLRHEDLLNLHPSDWEGGRFISLQAFLASDTDLSRKVKSLSDVLDYFDQADLDLSNWLSCGGGRADLAEFSNYMLSRMPEGAMGPPFYLGRIDSQMPPWFPASVVPVTRELLSLMKMAADGQAAKGDVGMVFRCGEGTGTKTVLLSGPSGDLPLKPGFSLT